MVYLCSTMNSLVLVRSLLNENAKVSSICVLHTVWHQRKEAVETPPVVVIVQNDSRVNLLINSSREISTRSPFMVCLHSTDEQLGSSFLYSMRMPKFRQEHRKSEPFIPVICPASGNTSC